MLYRLLAQPRPELANAVVCLRGQGRLAAAIAALGVPVHTLAMRRLVRFPDDWRRLWRITRYFAPDIVQGWMYHGNLAAQMICWRWQSCLPLIWNIRQSLHQFDREKKSTALLIRLEAKLSSWPAAIVYNAYVSARHHQAIGYHHARATVISNGFDTQEFSPQYYARQRLRQKLQLAPTTRLIGIVARYHPVKDHHSFFQAASLLGLRYPDVHFIAAGNGVDPGNLSLSTALDPAIKSRVHLLGDRSDIADITAALDIATCCSLAEGMANCIGEAMSCGVPCVVTDVGDSALLVGETGITVPPACPSALALAWQRLLENEEMRREKGKAARNRIINHYGIARFRENYWKLYQTLLPVPRPWL